MSHTGESAVYLPLREPVSVLWRKFRAQQKNSSQRCIHYNTTCPRCQGFFENLCILGILSGRRRSTKRVVRENRIKYTSPHDFSALRHDCQGPSDNTKGGRLIPCETASLDHRRLVLGMPKMRRRMGERMPGERRTTIFMSVDLLFRSYASICKDRGRCTDAAVRMPPCGNQSEDSMINTPPRRTDTKATLPVNSLDTANWRSRRRVARLSGYLQPSMSTPFTTASAAKTERYL